MRVALGALVLLTACADVGASRLAPLDRVSVEQLLAAGDDPSIERPVEHFLLPSGAADPDGLRAALADAGFEGVRVDRRAGFETTVVFLSDARGGTIARQIEWLEANAPVYGYTRTGWDTEPQTA